MNRPVRRLSLLVTLMFVALMAAATSIQFFQASSLNADSRNVRTLYREFGTDRGPIIVSGDSIATSEPADGPYKYQRTYRSDGAYSNVTGFFSTSFNSMTGIEKAENGVLGGSDSSLAGQRLQELVTGRQPQGGGVELTLDNDVQEAAINAMGGRRGAVVALEPSTGKVLAQVSLPTYDANSIATQDSEAANSAWTALNEDPEKPLVDRTSGGDQYAPGSTFKMLTAVAMLENSDMTPDTLIDAPTSWSPPGTSHEIFNPGQIACGDGSGEATLRQTFTQSCNTAYAIGGVDVGSDAMIEQAEKFGFGESFDTPLPVSASRFPEPENDAQLAMDSFGQQDIRVTPMQMAMITSAIANDGELMTPYIVNRTLTADLEEVSTTKPSKYSDPMSKQTAAYMQDMMVADVESGTGHRAAIDGVEVAGKTGTAEINADTLPHAWFAAFAPADDPEIAVVVLLENDPGDGGTSAAPVAREIIEAKLEP
ncbi:MAG: peptidoglycan D,D-transpeptidase FtsI family protein [Ancrocorticia sp.]|uniref:peptidoglycan D,D-transpeptidase FtsI family protein n=1 Tax=Ancrocorticia sp. TaxID=2593684 RepID=UPI003F8EFA2C